MTKLGIIVLGATLTSSPGAELDIAVSGSGATVRVHQGSLSVKSGAGDALEVKAGQAVAVGGKHPRPEFVP